MLRRTLVSCCLLALLGAAVVGTPALASGPAPKPAGGAPAGAGPAGPRVLLAFIPEHEYSAYSIQPIPPQNNKPLVPSQQLLFELARRPALSLGLMGASQGGYTPQQAVLDMSQGTRVSTQTYSPSIPPNMNLALTPGGGGRIVNWANVLVRAKSAPQTIDPGLLAGSIPGGAAYVSLRHHEHVDAVVAADRRGHVSSVSLGTRDTVVPRAQAALGRHSFVVADLPPDARGAAAVDQLIAARTPGELLIVAQLPNDTRGHKLLPTGIDDGGPGRRLDSKTTEIPGLVTGIDLLPTVLKHLHRPISSDVRGQAITLSGHADAKALQDLTNRLNVLGKRRMPTLEVLLLAWIALLMALSALRGWHAGRRTALRIGALAFMWVPVMILVPAAVEPGAAIVEMGIMVVGCFGLGWLTDRLLPWPRAPMLPCFASIVVLTAVVGSGSELLVRSLLGPNPSYGSRFFGIGNELKSGLTVLLLVGLAAAFGDRPRSRRLAWIVGLAGAALAVVIGAGKLGAGVGGVILVAAGVATATIMMLPGRPSKRAIALGVISPVVALAGLAAIDLLTAGGQGHFSHNVLHDHSLANLTDIARRRLELAAKGMIAGRMPIVIAACATAVWFAWRNRWLYDPLPTAMWRAALFGGLAAGIVGTVAEDSGPLLFVVAIFVLGVATAYVQGDPRLAREAGPRPGGRSEADRADAEAPAASSADRQQAASAA